MIIDFLLFLLVLIFNAVFYHQLLRDAFQNSKYMLPLQDLQFGLPIIIIGSLIIFFLNKLNIRKHLLIEKISFFD
jgi:hypothetical protein